MCPNDNHVLFKSIQNRWKDPPGKTKEGPNQKENLDPGLRSDEVGGRGTRPAPRSPKLRMEHGGNWNCKLRGGTSGAVQNWLVLLRLDLRSSIIFCYLKRKGEQKQDQKRTLHQLASLWATKLRRYPSTPKRTPPVDESGAARWAGSSPRPRHFSPWVPEMGFSQGDLLETSQPVTKTVPMGFQKKKKKEKKTHGLP